MNINLSYEDSPPRIERVQVLPYPDLKRLWVRIQLTSFAAHPNVEVSVLGPDGEVAAEMFVVENRETYLSLTLHLPAPVPGARYLARVALQRGHETVETLDMQEYPFDLVFVEPEDGARP
ncbi:MAG: hypothetical protein IT330_04835 [Anaerolineae bacterium]|nr:hypothetical protein [Anaerolineae bacterium]